MTPKRINKSKDQISDEIAYNAKLFRFKNMAARVFPLLLTDSVYDAQTALDAVSGFAKAELSEKEASFKINDLSLDFSAQPKGKITDTMNAIKVELQEENAKEVSDFLELFSRTFSSYGTNQFLKKPMSDIKASDIIA